MDGGLEERRRGLREEWGENNILFVIDPSENGLIVWFDDVSGLMVKARQEQLDEFTAAHCSAVLIC